MKALIPLLLVGLLPLRSRADSHRAWIVLIPGAASSGDQVYAPPLPSLFVNRYFGGFEDALQKDGFDEIVCPQTHDNDQRTIEEREKECVSQISTLPSRGARDVVILGHSTGGLIARELAQDSRVKDRIKSVILYATPNKGTVFADFVLDQEAQGVNPSSVLACLADFTTEKKHYLPELRSVRTNYPATDFTSQDEIDNPNISYVSISTTLHDDPLNYMNATALLIAAQLKVYGLANSAYGTQNDGVVPLYSEVYDHYLGNVDASHVDGPCPDQNRYGNGCKASLKVVLPILENEASSVREN